MVDERDENGYTRQERERSKSASLKDGASWAVMVGAGETFVSPFSIKLGADSGFSGIIQTVPQFIGAFAQLLSLPLESRIRDRRKVLALGVLLQALVWIPFAFIAYCALPGAAAGALDASAAIPANLLLPLVLLLYCLYQIFGQVVNPGWSTWMSELVQPGERGAYFANRLRITVAVQVVVVLLAGWFLDHSGWPALQGFVFLFACACLMRVVSGWYLSRMADHRPDRVCAQAAPAQAPQWGTYLSSPGMAEGRRFSLYVGALLTATYISSPFFDIFMLTILKMDYTTWSLLTLSQTLAKIFFYTYWGKIIDRFGNRAVLFGTGMLIPAISLLWVFDHSFWWLFFAQVFSGMAWSGFDLASFNYTISNPDPAMRTAQSSAYSFAKGTGMMVGMFIGLALFALLPRSSPLDPTPFLLVFFISSMARYAASAYFLPRFSSRTFEGGMNGRQFLWEVLALQPSRRMGRHLMDMSAASLNLAQAGIDQTSRVAASLREAPRTVHWLDRIGGHFAVGFTRSVERIRSEFDAFWRAMRIRK